MRCFECESEKEIQLHHVIPRSRGGKKTIPLCSICHGLVHDLERSDNHSRLVKEGQARALAAGKVIGQKKKRDDKLIIEFFNHDMTYRQIAEFAQCSLWSVQDCIKQYKKTQL